MRLNRAAISVGVCLLALCVLAWAQSSRKPGLWEITSNMSWQKSPFPPGMESMAQSHFGGGPHTSQICLTQEQIDKYGAPPPQTSQRDCQFTNIQKSAHGMSAEMVCTGAMNGKGTMEATWTDDSHTTSKVHFSGTMSMGANSRPVEWTVESTSVFKGSDCGSVKPFTMPEHH